LEGKVKLQNKPTGKPAKVSDSKKASLKIPVKKTTVNSPGINLGNHNETLLVS